jgi:16S rRNA (guanine527-N7)-methyltransferase
MRAGIRLFHVKHEAASALLPEVVVSRETTERLTIYADLLRTWSATVNLVSRGDLPHLWERHIADCLQILPLVPAEGLLADLGSGAGLPGLVLAIAADRPFHLVESDRRKAAFLREAARLTGARVTVVASRIEDTRLPPMRLITARALAPLAQLCAWSATLLAPDGAGVFLKGAGADAELTQARAQWHIRLRRWQSRTDPSGAILQLSELSRHAGP